MDWPPGENFALVIDTDSHLELGVGGSNNIPGRIVRYTDTPELNGSAAATNMAHPVPVWLCASSGLHIFCLDFWCGTSPVEVVRSTCHGFSSTLRKHLEGPIRITRNRLSSTPKQIILPPSTETPQGVSREILSRGPDFTPGEAAPREGVSQEILDGASQGRVHGRSRGEERYFGDGNQKINKSHQTCLGFFVRGGGLENNTLKRHGPSDLPAPYSLP